MGTFFRFPFFGNPYTPAEISGRFFPIGPATFSPASTFPFRIVSHRFAHFPLHPVFPMSSMSTSAESVSAFEKKMRKYENSECLQICYLFPTEQFGQKPIPQLPNDRSRSEKKQRDKKNPDKNPSHSVPMSMSFLHNLFLINILRGIRT